MTTASLILSVMLLVDWSANAEPDVAGYTVYADGQAVAEVTSPTTSARVMACRTMRFTVTASDHSGNESGHSVAAWFYVIEPHEPFPVLWFRRARITRPLKITAPCILRALGATQLKRGGGADGVLAKTRKGRT